MRSPLSGLNQRGHALFSALVVLLIAVLGALGCLMIAHYGMRAFRTSQRNASIERLVSLAKIVLASPESCAYNFVSLEQGIVERLRMPAAEHSLEIDNLTPRPFKKLKPSPVIAKDRSYDGVKVASLILRRWGSEQPDAMLGPDVRIAELEMGFKLEGLFLGPRFTVRHVPIAVRIDGLGNIVSCRTY